PTVALVYRNDGYDRAMALARTAGPVAARSEFQLRRSDHRRLGPMGRRVAWGWARSARLRVAVRRQSFRLASKRVDRGCSAALRARRSSAGAGPGGAQWLRPLERSGAGVDADGLRMAHRSIRH